MKRTFPQTHGESNHFTLDEIREQLKELTTSLSYLNRDELLSFIRHLDDAKSEANKFLAVECNQIVKNVPDEIWEKILSLVQVGEEKPKIYNREYDLLLESLYRKLSCVSKQWSSIIDNYVPRIFFPNTTPWILLKHRNRNLQELSLSSITALQDRERIFDHVLVQFSSLTSLSLAFNTDITSECVEHLTNLTNLNLSSNLLISSDAVEKLTKLKKLNVSYNPNISASTILKLPHLEELSFSSSSLVYNEVLRLGELTNLQILNITMSADPDLDPDDDDPELETKMIEYVLSHLVNLRELSLSCYPTFQCSVLSSLSNLKTFRLFTETDELGLEEWASTNNDLKLLTNLTHFSTNVPCFSNEGLKHLTNLTDLSFRSNTITENAFKDLTLLTSLSISPDVQVSPEGFSKLTKLEYLNIGEHLSWDRESRMEEKKLLSKYLPNLKMKD